MSAGSRDGSSRKNEQMLMELLKQDANKHCADCGQKGTRWASWNLGVFLCIRCGGLHRKLGTHISRVKSVNLDKWTDEQVESISSQGNAKVNAIYNPHPERFPFPSYSGDMESYIRDKYERKLFMNPDARGSDARASSSHASSRPDPTRYPLQMKALQGMGFTNLNSNAAALATTHGNLQEALDILLASKASTLSVSPPAVREEGASRPFRSNPAEDLVGVFSMPPPPPSSHHRATTTTTAGSSPPAAGKSILDMDPAELQASSQEIPSPEEFEEFESAPAPRRSSRTEGLKADDFAGLGTESSTEARHHDPTPTAAAAPYHHMTSLKTAATPSLNDLSNPWASTQNHSTSGEAGRSRSTDLDPSATTARSSPVASNGDDAFDDIDPFRGYTPHRA